MCVCALYILKMYLLYYIYYGYDLRLCMYTYMFLCSLSIQAMNLSCMYIYICVCELYAMIQFKKKNHSMDTR